MDFLSLEKTEQPINKSQDVRVDLRIVSTKTLDHPLDPNERTILIAHSNASFEAVYVFQNESEKLGTEPFEQGHLIHWSDRIPPNIQALFTLHTANRGFAKDPIWDTCSAKTGKQVLSIPAYGLISNEWTDGWMTHFSKTGKVLSVIPPGIQSRLYVPLTTPTCSGLTWEETREALPPLEELQRQSILDCLLTRVDTQTLKMISIRDFSLEEASQLLLLRQAFPNEDFEITHPLEKKEWPPRFKNFLESIRASWKQSTEGIDTKELFKGISKEAIINLTPLLNKKTKILEGLRH